MANKQTNNRTKMNTVQTWSRRKAISAADFIVEEKKRTQTWIYWDRWEKVIFLLDLAQMDILTVRQLYMDLSSAHVVQQSKLAELRAELEGKTSFMPASITELRGRIHKHRTYIARIIRFCGEAKLLISEYNRKNAQAPVNLTNAKVRELPSRTEKELSDELWMDRKQGQHGTSGAYNKLRELLGTDFDQWERENDLQAIERAMEKARQEGIPEQSIQTWHLIKLRALEINQQRKAQARLKGGQGRLCHTR
jgi:hypothetical protein